MELLVGWMPVLHEFIHKQVKILAKQPKLTWCSYTCLHFSLAWPHSVMQEREGVW